MKIKPEKKVLKLEPITVDLISEDIQEFLTVLGTQKKNLLAARLTMENILLDFMDHFGSDAEVTYFENNFLGKPYISISVEGEEFNPLEKDGDDEFGNWSSSLISNSDFTPIYSYEKGVNVITMRFSKKELNPIFKLLIAIVLASIVSLLKFSLPQSTMDYIVSDILGPINETFLGLMETFEVPLVFLSITCGIIGIGDSNVFGKIGRKMVIRFVGVIFVITAVAGFLFTLIFYRAGSTTEGSMAIKGGFKMILDIIPNGVLEPFVSGNTLQVAFVAIVIGVTLIILGTQVKTLQTIINESNRIIVYVTGYISKFLPGFIFFIILNIIWSGNLSRYLRMWKLFAAYIAVVIVIFVFCLFLVSFEEHVSVKIMIKKMLPTFLIGLGTASSTALDGESSDCMSRRMGINSRFVSFGQPTGSTIFMPATAINFICCAIFMASYYDMSISIIWLVIAMAICTFVSIATPPVTGGAMAAYTIVFTQLGLPAEAVAIVVSLDILFDLIATAFDSVFLQLELLRQADKNNMLNFEKLRSEI